MGNSSSYKFYHEAPKKGPPKKPKIPSPPMIFGTGAGNFYSAWNREFTKFNARWEAYHSYCEDKKENN